MALTTRPKPQQIDDRDTVLDDAVVVPVPSRTEARHNDLREDNRPQMVPERWCLAALSLGLPPRDRPALASYCS